MTIDTDLFVVVGLVLAALSLSSLLGALVERRFPVVALLVFAIGAALAAAGVYTAPNGYGLGDVPHSFVEILARLVN